jgi:CHAD domain-containing protein
MAPSSKKLARKTAVGGARKLTLHHLKRAEAAVERLDDPSDTEALHDLRVELRHVRTYLRTYRKLFSQAVPPKREEALRDLAHLTNPARDAEVHTAWLAKQPPIRQSRTGAASRMLSQLNQQHAEVRQQLRERFTQDFPHLAQRLRRQLKRAKAPGKGPFGKYAAKKLRRLSQRLRQRLDHIQGPTDVENCHEARITAKRVRYLLEPFDELPGANETLEHLKALQDTLGDMHDLHVLLESLSSRSPELKSLATKARRQLPPLYRQLQRRGLGKAGARLDEALAEMASTLRKTAKP